MGLIPKFVSNYLKNRHRCYYRSGMFNMFSDVESTLQHFFWLDEPTELRTLANFCNQGALIDNKSFKYLYGGVYKYIYKYEFKLRYYKNTIEKIDSKLAECLPEYAITYKKHRQHDGEDVMVYLRAYNDGNSITIECDLDSTEMYNITVNVDMSGDLKNILKSKDSIELKYHHFFIFKCYDIFSTSV